MINHVYQIVIVWLFFSYSRFRRSHSESEQNFLSSESHSGYPRFVSSPYAHPFFKQDFRERSYDVGQFPRNHSYPQTPSAPSTHVTVKQEPKDQGFETSGKFDSSFFLGGGASFWFLSSPQCCKSWRQTYEMLELLYFKWSDTQHAVVLLDQTLQGMEVLKKVYLWQNWTDWLNLW